MAKMTSSCHDNNKSGMQFDTWNVEGVIAHEQGYFQFYEAR